MSPIEMEAIDRVPRGRDSIGYIPASIILTLMAMGALVGFGVAVLVGVWR